MEKILEQENENVKLDTEQKKKIIKKYINTITCTKWGHTMETEQEASERLYTSQEKALTGMESQESGKWLEG